MQDKHSRRNFLGLAATLAAAGCGSPQAPTASANVSPDEPANHGAAAAGARAMAVTRDHSIAAYFVNKAKKFSAYAAEGEVIAAVNIYGMAMMDSAHDCALLPNTKDFKYPGNDDDDEKLPVHFPRLWSSSDPKSQGLPAKSDGDLFYWDLTGKTVSFEWWLDNELIAETSSAGNLRASNRHPWANDDFLPSVCNHAGTSILPPADRENANKVATYVKFGKSDVLLSPPWSAAGTVSEWQLKIDDGSEDWKPVGSVRALTDNVTVVRKRPQSAKPDLVEFRVSIRDFGAQAAQYLVFKPKKDSPTCLALTHASNHKAGAGAGTLRDMYAFARVTRLAESDYAKFPIAHFVRGIRGEDFPPAGGAFLSDEDGHCPFVQE